MSALPDRGTCGTCGTGYSLVHPVARCQCGRPTAAPIDWRAATVADAPWRLNPARPPVVGSGSVGGPVHPFTGEELVRIYGAEEACPDCVVAGHVCRDCRAMAYASRQEYGLRAALVVSFYALGVLACVSAIVWGLYHG